MHCSDPWPIVSLAFFLRYPNPYASHILSCDVISRKFTPSGALLTTRLILKSGAVPRWAKHIVSRSESWIIEESEVDPHGKVVRCLTRNLEHVKAMQVHETQTFSQLGEGCVDILLFFHTRLTRVFKENSADYGSSNRFRVWMGPYEADRELWPRTFQEKRSAGTSFHENQPSSLMRSTQSREGVTLILDLIRQARRQPMTLSSSYLNPTSASRLATNRASDQLRFEPHQVSEADDSPHWD
jgi:hypothetical protein